MTPTRPSLGSAPISDTGLPVPRGVDMRLFALADSTGLQVPSSAGTIPAAVAQSPNERAAPAAAEPPEKSKGYSPPVEADQPAAFIGHNSRKAQVPKAESGNPPAWATPSKLGFEDAANANAGAGRHLHQLTVLSEAIFDERLGETSIALKFIAAALRYSNRDTGSSFPGLRTLAEDIYRDLMQLPPKTAATIMRKASALTQQCGYAVTRKQAPPAGGHAVTHYAFTYPDRAEKAAAITAHRGASGNSASYLSTSGNSLDNLSSGNSASYLSGGSGNCASSPEVTKPVRFDPAHSITEPKREPLVDADASSADARLPLEGGASQEGTRLGAKPKEKRVAAPAADRGTRWPKGQAVPEEWRTWAAREFRVAPGDIRREAHTFADWWPAKAGKDAAKLDWEGTWRNWCRRAFKGKERIDADAEPAADPGADLDAQLEQRRRAMRESRS